VIHGFEARAVYLEDTGRPMGARLVHRATGFTLDLLRIQSVPQGFIWVTTYPTSNMGEPHTQEHLLLGKGNMGRAVANLEGMSLATSSAFTQQWRTCYDFYTAAGAEVFFDQFARRMDALLHPDYSDEEIRREVRNFGVSPVPGQSTLRLEEKGTVYNEMVSSMDQPGSRLYRAIGVDVYGPEHPMAFNSGGLPEALRVLQPADIRKFHAANYHLANMGQVTSLPREMALGPTLARFDTMLVKLQGAAARRSVRGEADLPAPQPAPTGQIRIVEYPHKNERQPGTVYLGWPANRQMDQAGRILLDLFLENLAGDATTNLYKRFIDSRTREIDLGARGVFARLSPNPGYPILIGLRDVAATHIDEREMADLRRRVREELARIAAWPSGSAELAEFNQRLVARITETRRDLAKFTNTPPGFGFRNTRATWLEHLDLLALGGEFRRSVTLQPQLAAIEKRLAAPDNLWHDLLATWKLLDTEPYAAGTRANPALLDQAQRERAERVRAETARLAGEYGASSEQEALRRYRAEYDKATEAIEEAARRVPQPRFMDKPPLGLDDQLDYKVSGLTGGVPLVASTFDGIASATVGLVLRLDGVPASRLVYLSALPALLTRVGVIENGLPVSYEQMTERMRREILGMNAYVRANFRTGRAELVLRGSGNNAAESRRALEWIRLALYHPDWRPDNLPRIRDLLDQTLSALRNTTQAPEEHWVQAPANAWRRQDNPALLATNCFLTQAYNVHRLRWMLKGGAADDLDQLLADVPESSRAQDRRQVSEQMRRDSMVTPAKALAELDALRRGLLTTGGARLFSIASAEGHRALAPGIDVLLKGLTQAPAAAAKHAATRRIEARLRARDPEATAPLFVGLLNANSQGGVLLLSAPGAHYEDTDRDKLLDYLAGNQLGGHGAHGLFMKTWGAGLAYSNGVRPSPSTGRLNYYAERTPELPQTLRFVIGEVRAARPDAAMAEYAIAESFSEIRAASSYEWRGEAMAQDLADGVTPAVVARFHKALLELRRTPDLSAELARRMPRVYARVMPGLGAPVKDVAGGVYFVIGPEKQIAAWEQYLQSIYGAATRVHRLYPRDFWMPEE
jgi:Zn-dependent M16 (insulinase) family peptidase